MNVSKDGSVVIMNVTDPLENHRKNLHNFYTACNVFCDAEKSNGGENAPSSFLPFFQFVGTSSSESIEKFRGPENFVQNNVQHHDVPNGKPTDCDIEMNCEINDHSEEERTLFSCEHCAKTFLHKKAITRHISKCSVRLQVKQERKRLDEIRPKKWTKSAIVEKTCKICGHIARKPCELKLHLSKHTGERPFLCKECGIGFSSTSKLNRHIRNKVHAKGKLYCKPCKRYFFSEANYERHESEHSLPTIEKKPFACSICDKRFSRVDILRKHTDVHSQENRELFECVACARKFSRKDTLSRHVRQNKCGENNRKH